jgi:hypothetical protein
MEARRQQLTSFYAGPVWKVHRETAIETMLDTDDVLLLHPTRVSSGFRLENASRPALGATAATSPLLVATIYHCARPIEPGFVKFFEHRLAPALAETGAPVLAYFETEDSPNNYPVHPIREGENVFVWFSRFSGSKEYEAHRLALHSLKDGPALASELARWVERPEEVLRLESTPRSLIG